MTRAFTPSQTVGPFFSIGMAWPDGPYVVREGAPGAVWIRGRVLDGEGDAVPDAVVETWQASPDGTFPAGRYAARGDELEFRGFGRSATARDGSFGVHTLKPGRVRDAEGRLQSPHVAIAVFARGLIEHLVTRMYFADEDNEADPHWRSLGANPRRQTLLATFENGVYRFDIRLQGPDETIFFSL